MADTGEGDSEYRIKEGDNVVLKRGDIFKAVQIQLKKKIIFEKQWFFLDNAIGHLYRSTFEIVSGNLQAQTAKTTQSSSDAKEAGTDNRNIVDDGKSQKLTRDDIETLKEQGLKGQEIIQQLIENSSTFRDKTEFAQDKYIKKKKKKYENTIMILKPSCRILAMMYHGREPGKICHLRYDTLAQMLTLANIHAGSKVLVFETCAGLVLGAVMERMGGYGSVIQMYPGGGPARAGVENFGFPAHFHDTLHDFPICHVNALLAGTLDTSHKDTNKKESDQAAEDKQNQPEAEPQDSPEEQTMETGGNNETAMDQERKEKEQRREAKAEEKRRKLAAAAALLEGRNADGLIIASRFHPCPVLMGLLKFLSPSRPFVVYSQYKEPLVECFTKLKEHGGTVNLRLTDTWLRHYQVLPNRTHPLLLMSGGGGYILSGTTVAVDSAKPSGSTPAEEPATKKMKLTDTVE
ncbi:tRNA (adenine(58)-N(1))-methyltransferase non-catalytic subunit TRM6 [Cynoglossus semilaevis]|uniref:tRNA (adenine(58)-N(1))-methyltransferase non-catalytic subunit TRM6 n=1 Tax=Cynoglossus semilaevis TaxID=244447 RepID=A0A3P8UNH5_CYNSE|nr:tRNA (adenine(58)-N(1))-methyltransferase non-catalytic subunit TRM6 [Cynoglossus semilaevis]XP_008311455.1 tRNA (adenine(58)-N(1))-methyltransferase non-catalytic subunit TRM6 [Cynoglossus semilaevis]